ncbi:uncharacterized protein LOC117176532 [Belonocnema kinseyi]|uniref:uncharacterized protein LOC117176532 n=1 Tax=Belonocnema kinseyi TaxID=2817044 RepID=UPI00143DE421|nr:uncharacterized protein LOC117176532 [Belonocnema kinseyi]
MLVDKPTRERTRPVRSTKNIAAVAESVREQPSTSTRHRSQQLAISRTSLMRILRKDLAMKPYKVQLVHQLKPIDHPNRLQFANWAEDRLIEDDEFYRKIIFLDEAHFHLGESRSFGSGIESSTGIHVILTGVIIDMI